jgi:hypothetical protein
MVSDALPNAQVPMHADLAVTQNPGVDEPLLNGAEPRCSIAAARWRSVALKPSDQGSATVCILLVKLTNQVFKLFSTLQKRTEKNS